MSFDIKPVEKPKVYLTSAFTKARTKASIKKKSLRIDIVSKTRILELIKIDTVCDNLDKKLRGITDNFPNFENLTDFYTEMVYATLDYPELKKSLGSIEWARKKVHEFSNQYRKKIRSARDIEFIKKFGKEYFGRVASALNQIKAKFDFLEKARLTIRDYPSIKDGLFTVAIAGFPNIGKSTLLSKLTDAKPEIQAYAFTTKGLNVGYMKIGPYKVQFIDTPGTLDREDKMNNVEKIAYLAMKYCANMIIYVYDLTEPYSLQDQEELFKKVEDYDKKTIIYLSKTDILDKKVVDAFKKKVKCISDVEELKSIIESNFNEFSRG